MLKTDEYYAVEESSERNDGLFMRAVDGARTIPLAIAVIVPSYAAGIPFAIHRLQSQNYAVVAVFSGSLVLQTLNAGSLAKRQFALRKRLETSIKRNGFDDRIFGKTVEHWCDRQTARVIARNADALDSYEALCDEKRPIQAFSWLPDVG